jgi:hypothetical protein
MMRHVTVALVLVAFVGSSMAAQQAGQGAPAPGAAPAAQAAQGGQGQGAGQGQGQAQGRQGGGGGRRGGGPPPGPAPRDANGRALLVTTTKEKGLWLPVFGILDPILSVKETPYQPWARAVYDDRQKHEMEPHTRCKPSGVARQFLTPYGVEFVELLDQQRMYIFDVGGPHTYRTIYMDGRTHPKDFKPTYYGHSIGWWEGDTLVVDSVGFNEEFWLDRRGMPHTEKLHTIEKFTRINSANVAYEVTVDDPGAYTAPWTAKFSLRWEPNQELFEYICQQANYASDLMTGETKRPGVKDAVQVWP